MDVGGEETAAGSWGLFRAVSPFLLEGRCLLSHAATEPLLWPLKSRTSVDTWTAFVLSFLLILPDILPSSYFSAAVQTGRCISRSVPRPPNTRNGCLERARSRHDIALCGPAPAAMTCFAHGPSSPLQLAVCTCNFIYSPCVSRYLKRRSYTVAQWRVHTVCIGGENAIHSPSAFICVYRVPPPPYDPTRFPTITLLRVHRVALSVLVGPASSRFADLHSQPRSPRASSVLRR